MTTYPFLLENSSTNSTIWLRVLYVSDMSRRLDVILEWTAIGKLQGAGRHSHGVYWRASAANVCEPVALDSTLPKGPNSQ